MVRLAAAISAAWIALTPVTAASAAAVWEDWKPIKGVFDVDGPRTDGSLVVAGSAALYLVNPTGDVNAFARGPGGYHEDPGAEAYLAVSRGGDVAAAGCSFTADETFILRLHVPIGITRVNASGDETGSFANLTGVSTLNGIAFDTVGSFDHRLLVTGPAGGKTTVFAIDCNGAVKVITRSAPALEGGLAVAPSTFGPFGGDLIAPDELSGKIYAIAPDGKVTLVTRPVLPTGGDIGVESLAFVPEGFVSRGGAAYYPDRLTPGNAHPGTDHLLRLTSDSLGAAGVQEGDMLVATEGGASLIAIRCGPSCSIVPVVSAATKAHGEGHLAFTVNAPPPSATPAPPVGRQSPVPAAVVDFVGQWGIAAVVIVLLLGVVAGLAVQAFRHRAK